MEQVYLRYIQLGNSISSLEQERKILSDRILQHMLAVQSSRVNTNLGIISLKKRSTWKYHPHIKAKIEEVQKHAQENGGADRSETTYLSTSLQ